MGVHFLKIIIFLIFTPTFHLRIDEVIKYMYVDLCICFVTFQFNQNAKIFWLNRIVAHESITSYWKCVGYNISLEYDKLKNLITCCKFQISENVYSMK